jgi:hypothetical protein
MLPGDVDGGKETGGASSADDNLFIQCLKLKAAVERLQV